MTIPSPDEASKNPIPWILALIGILFISYMLVGGSESGPECDNTQYSASTC